MPADIACINCSNTFTYTRGKYLHFYVLSRLYYIRIIQVHFIRNHF